MRRFRLLGITAAVLGILSFGGIPALAQGTPQGDNFYTGEAVSMQKVTFKNQYKMTVAGNLFLPKALDQNLKHPAVIVGHPMGAVKEQSANLYAAKMAEQGFVALSLDLSFWGKARASHAMPFPRTSMPRISAPPWIFSAPGPLSTGNRSGPSGFAAAGALCSAPPRLTRA